MGLEGPNRGEGMGFVGEGGGKGVGGRNRDWSVVWTVRFVMQATMLHVALIKVTNL